MEFQLISPQTFIEAIKFNYDDLHNWVAAQTEKYQNLIYTDDTIKEAKEDRAALNRFRENLDNARKDVKKRILEPYNVFEADMKKLLAIVDEPLNAIDAQVKDYEERKKAEKKSKIEEFFIQCAGDLTNFVTLDKIFNQKWLNASVSLKNVQDEISSILIKTRSDFNTIKDLKSEWELTLIDTYFNTLDIGAALREQKRLEEQKKALEELKAKEEAEKQAFILPDKNGDFEASDHSGQVSDMVQSTGVIRDVSIPGEYEKLQPGDIIRFGGEPETPKLYTRKFWVMGTKEQIIALGQYIIDHGLRYGGIK